MSNKSVASFNLFDNFSPVDGQKSIDEIEIAESALFGLSADELNQRLLKAIYFPDQYGGNIPQTLIDKRQFD